MKAILFILAMATAVSARGQNNPIFDGGDGDGWAVASFTQAGNSIFEGSAGDGWASAISEVKVLAVEENTFGEGLVAYPNPTAHGLTIDFGVVRDVVELELVDALGKFVMKKIYRLLDSITVSIDGAAGVYYARLNANENVTIVKIIKQ